MMTQTALYEQLLPLERSAQKSGTLPEYDGEAEEILARIVPSYVGGVMYSAVAEALALQSPCQ